MNYCILRIAKLSQFGNIAGSAGHTFRELPTPNADPMRTPNNKTIGAKGMAAVCAAVRSRLPHNPKRKIRKDAVRCVEYLITASPEWFKDKKEKEYLEYFRSAVRWLYAKHGKANVVSINLQLDETTPHLVAYVVPITPDGRLAAKDFFGDREKLSDMQTDFHEKVGQALGLQRGIEGSKAVHTTNKEYNAALQKNPELKPPKRPTPPAPAPAPTILDRVSGRAAEMQSEHEAKLKKHAEEVADYRAKHSQYVSLLEQARNVSLITLRARARQMAEHEELRRKAGEAARLEVKARKLKEENNRLIDHVQKQEQAFAEERRTFRDAIANLKQQLQTALGEIERLVARIFSLERKLRPDDPSESSITSVRP